MPILEVEIVSAETSKNPPAGLAQSLADAAADVLGSPHGDTWVRLRLIPAEWYAENGGQPEGVYPVFVTVLKSRVPEESELETEIAALTRVLARVLNRPPENVHLIYPPAAAGRVAFGGKLVR